MKSERVLRPVQKLGLNVIDLAKDPHAAGPLARSTTRESNLVSNLFANLAATLLVGLIANVAVAQNSSLYQKPFAYASTRTAQQPANESLPSPTRESVRSETARPESARPGSASPSAPNTGIQQPGTGMAGGIPQQAGPQQMSPYQTEMPYMQHPGEASIPMGLQSSWTYIPPTPMRTLKLHDIVSIRVEEASTSLAVGNATSRKTTSYDAVLRDWIRLVGIDTIKPAPQADGDPRVQSIQNEVYRGDSTLRTNESMTTNIAAEIVDIRPNGLIVLSGTKTIIQNDNTFQFSLTGTCRSQDILPDNTILSRNLINATMNKQDQGHVRDGYSRGWLTKFLARIKPF